ncbi:hypothetical protein ANN_24577 [Periplaneta americana]|uniref:Uncharacterized protein n=1 Tax=Periplaneta americana TaxID=6978 RepID=A0ABQ8S3E1_PERAM|nr:hypothetical protein ANN_24577 [Periplaneta americana]
MSPGSSTESYPAFARILLRENPGKNINQVNCPDRDSNPGHLVSQPDALTVTPQIYASITSCNIEIIFSQYKHCLRNGRQYNVRCIMNTQFVNEYSVRPFVHYVSSTFFFVQRHICPFHNSSIRGELVSTGNRVISDSSLKSKVYETRSADLTLKYYGQLLSRNVGLGSVVGIALAFCARGCGFEDVRSKVYETRPADLTLKYYGQLLSRNVGLGIALAFCARGCEFVPGPVDDI